MTTRRTFRPSCSTSVSSARRESFAAAFIRASATCGSRTGLAGAGFTGAGWAREQASPRRRRPARSSAWRAASPPPARECWPERRQWPSPSTVLRGLRGGRRGLGRLHRGDDDDARGLAAGLGVLGLGVLGLGGGSRVGGRRIPSQLGDGIHQRRAGLGRVRLRSGSRSRLGDSRRGRLARGLRAAAASWARAARPAVPSAHGPDRPCCCRRGCR